MITNIENKNKHFIWQGDVRIWLPIISICFCVFGLISLIAEAKKRKEVLDILEHGDKIRSSCEKKGYSDSVTFYKTGGKRICGYVTERIEEKAKHNAFLANHMKGDIK